ncbi:MAG: outer membrane beta-barrel protein [Bacteroidetes bacterium]|nr:outer membrane beta-barrel protein [Bacteroidota bacterium]
MKKQLFTVLFTFICIWGFSQNSNFQLGVHFQPKFSKSNVEREGGFKHGGFRFSYSMGLTVGYDLSDRLLIEGGLTLMNIGDKTIEDFDDLRWPSQHDGDGGYDPSLPSNEDFGDFSIKYNHAFIEVPFKLRYFAFAKIPSLYITGGVSALINIRNSTLTKETFSDGSSEKRKENILTPRFHRFNAAISTSIGYEHSFTNGMRLFVEPTFQIIPYNIAPQDIEVNRRYYSFGLNTGLRFN